MKYLDICKFYEKISSTTKRLEKTDIIVDFLKNLESPKYIYLLVGRVLPDYDVRELGISQQILIKAISKSFGIDSLEVTNQFNEIGDLGDVSEILIKKNSQTVLFSSELSVEKIFNNLLKIFEIEGEKSIEKKISLISELYSMASPLEAKYISRTILGNLRIGVSTPTIIDAISKTFFEGNLKELIQEKYDLSNDFLEIYNACLLGEQELEKISISPGKPLNVMLAIKSNTIEESLEICGKPAAIEQKYDGFRVIISKDNSGEIKLFTRKLEDVTTQFPDVVEVIEKNIKSKTFILDSEVVGYDTKTKRYLPFESISQRIRRKYEIEKLTKELPVEINIFDCLFVDGIDVTRKKFIERRRLLENIVVEEKLKIRLAIQIISDNENEINDFFLKAVESGEEGIMIKKIDAQYRPGRRVGYMCKLKPEVNDLDLVIIGAEYGTGKRSGSFTSFILACREEEELVAVGKASSGLKEKEEEGLTYEQMTELLRPLITEEDEKGVKINPKIVVSISYQNIQISPSYSSGFALRFPRITKYRPDRGWKDIATIDEIRRESDRFRTKV